MRHPHLNNFTFFIITNHRQNANEVSLRVTCVCSMTQSSHSSHCKHSSETYSRLVLQLATTKHDCIIFMFRLSLKYRSVSVSSARVTRLGDVMCKRKLSIKFSLPRCCYCCCGSENWLRMVNKIFYDNYSCTKQPQTNCRQSVE